MEVAGEGGAVDHAELRQICLQVRAATLNLVAAQLDRRRVVVCLGEPAVRVGDSLIGEALENVYRNSLYPPMRHAVKRVDRKIVLTQSGSSSRRTVRTSSGAMRNP